MKRVAYLICAMTCGVIALHASQAHADMISLICTEPYFTNYPNYFTINRTLQMNSLLDHADIVNLPSANCEIDLDGHSASSTGTVLGSFVAEPVTDGNDPKNPIIQILLRNAIPAVHADSIPRINILIDRRTGNYVHKQEVIDKDNNISGGITVFYGICGTHKTLF